MSSLTLVVVAVVVVVFVVFGIVYWLESRRTEVHPRSGAAQRPEPSAAADPEGSNRRGPG